MVNEANRIILDAKVQPWDCAILSRLIMRGFLLRQDIHSFAPQSFIWDALHAVIVAAIRAGSDYRNDILRQLTAFTHSFTTPNAQLYE